MNCKSLDNGSENFVCLTSIRNSLLKLGRPTAKPSYNHHKPIGLKLFTSLRLGLSHCNEHKFKHNFQDYVNFLCSCSLETKWPKSLSHFFRPCHYFTNICATLISEFQSFDINIPKFPDNEIVELPVYGSSKFDSKQDYKILSSCISFILQREKFNGLLL